MTDPPRRLSLLLPFLVVLCGCLEIDVEERLEVRDDLSGVVAVRVRGPERALTHILESRQRGADRLRGIRLAHARITGEGPSQALHLRYEFSNLEEVDPDSLAGEEEAGSYAFETREDGSIAIERTLSLPGGSYLLEIKLPPKLALVSHNAESNDAGVLRWYTEFGPEQAKERTIALVVEPRLPWLQLGVYGVLGLLGLFVLSRLLRLTFGRG